MLTWWRSWCCGATVDNDKRTKPSVSNNELTTSDLLCGGRSNTFSTQPGRNTTTLTTDGLKPSADHVANDDAAASTTEHSSEPQPPDCAGQCEQDGVGNLMDTNGEGIPDEAVTGMDMLYDSSGANRYASHEGNRKFSDLIQANATDYELAKNVMKARPR